MRPPRAPARNRREKPPPATNAAGSLPSRERFTLLARCKEACQQGFLLRFVCGCAVRSRQHTARSLLRLRVVGIFSRFRTIARGLRLVRGRLGRIARDGQALSRRLYAPERQIGERMRVLDDAAAQVGLGLR